jgi:spore maturation protein CgeB
MRDPAADHPTRCHPPVSGRAYLELLRSAGTVVHRGIDALGDCGGALRLFEVTGVGAALLVEDSPMIRQLFDVGHEVITYRDPQEAVEQARWLTAHPEERERIALAGQRRTLQDHTAAARARSLDPILGAAIGSG